MYPRPWYYWRDGVRLASCCDPHTALTVGDLRRGWADVDEATPILVAHDSRQVDWAQPVLVQNEIDEHDLAVTGAHRPRLPGSRFVLVTVTPQVSTSEQREGKP